MRLPNNLQSTVDNGHFQEWILLLQSLDNFLDNIQLSLDSDRVAVIIDDTVEDVSELDDHDVLLDEGVEDLVQEVLEELVVVQQLQGQSELVLEVHPNSVRFPCLDLLRSEQDFFFKVSIKRLGTFPVLPKLVTFHKPFLLHLILGHLDYVHVLVIVHVVPIGQLHQVLHGHSCC